MFSYGCLECTDEPNEPGPSRSDTTPGTTENRDSSALGVVSVPPNTSRQRKGQATISGYLSHTRPLNVNHQKRIDHQLTKMIVKG